MSSPGETPTTGEMFAEILDVLTGVGILVLPLVILAIPALILLLPVAVLLILPLAVLLILFALLAGPYLLIRSVRRGLARMRAAPRGSREVGARGDDALRSPSGPQPSSRPSRASTTS
jgi:hypothetical protein